MLHQWSWNLLRAGSFRLDGGGMFGVVPKTLWSKLVHADENNRIPLQTNCLLLDDGSTKILIETGFGNKWSDKERGFFDLERRSVVDALREIDVDVADIDHIILTHLHFDHAAGLTTMPSQSSAAGDATLVFPNADIFVQKSEWEDALANKSTMTKTYLRNHLEPITNRVRLIEGDGEILPGIAVWPVPGHTWGQQAVRFSDDGGVICFLGDVIPTVHHAGLAFSLGYDMMPYQSMMTKKSTLEKAANEGWRIALDHEPGEAVVRVHAHAERAGQFELTPV